MNVFSKQRVDQLRCLGLKPLLILHLKKKNNKNPSIPVNLMLPLHEELKNDEKLFILCGNHDCITDVTEITSHKIWKYFITVYLDTSYSM